MHNYIQNPDKNQLVQQAAELTQVVIDQCVKEKGKALLAIAGGSSLVDLFQYWLELPLNWDKVHLFWVDERFVDFSDPLSNYYQAKTIFLDQLLNKGKILPEQIHTWSPECKTVELASIDYENTYKKYGILGFDLAIFGSGEDGHIASLFPGHNWPDKGCYFPVTDSPKPPAKRVSITPAMVAESSYSLLWFLGQSKKQALADFKNPAIDPKQCPAKLVLNSKNSYVFTNLS